MVDLICQREDSTFNFMFHLLANDQQFCHWVFPINLVDLEFGKYRSTSIDHVEHGWHDINAWRVGSSRILFESFEMKLILKNLQYRVPQIFSLLMKLTINGKGPFWLDFLLKDGSGTLLLKRNLTSHINSMINENYLEKTFKSTLKLKILYLINSNSIVSLLLIIWIALVETLVKIHKT